MFVSNNFIIPKYRIKSLTYDLEVVDHPEIKISRFEPFTLSPWKMAKKKLLYLKQKKVLVNDKTKIHQLQ